MVNDLDIVLNSELNNTNNRYNKWMTDTNYSKIVSKLVRNFILVPPKPLRNIHYNI